MQQAFNVLREELPEWLKNTVGNWRDDFYDNLDTIALATVPFPVVGDISGLAADAKMYKEHPDKRTLGNYALSLMGVAPFVPSMAVSKYIKDIPKNTSQFKSDIPNKQWLNEQVEYALEKGKDKFGVPYMGKTTGQFSSTVNIPIEKLEKVRGMRGEQSNVRKDSLEWLVENMGKSGKLPLTQYGDEYAPFIMVDMYGTPWVNEGNHRIMAAKKLGWKYLPVEVRYYDGGELVNGAFSPDKLIK